MTCLAQLIQWRRYLDPTVMFYAFDKSAFISTLNGVEKKKQNYQLSMEPGMELHLCPQGLKKAHLSAISIAFSFPFGLLMKQSTPRPTMITAMMAPVMRATVPLSIGTV